MKIYLPARVTRLLQAAAAEVHPYETQGILLGNVEGREVWVEATYAYQRKILANNKSWVEVQDEEEYRIDDFFEGEIVGDFHSHPDATPAISSQDKENLLNEGDGFVSLIMSVWPSPKGLGWAFRLFAYYNDKGKVRRGKVVKV